MSVLGSRKLDMLQSGSVTVRCDLCKTSRITTQGTPEQRARAMKAQGWEHVDAGRACARCLQWRKDSHED